MTAKEFYKEIIKNYLDDKVLGDPEHAAAPYPAFDPLMINTRCFEYELRPKMCCISEINDILHIEWEYNSSVTDTDNFEKEIVRFLCTCYKKYELTEPITAEIKVYPRFYEEPHRIEILGLFVDGNEKAQIYENNLFTEEELNNRSVGEINKNFINNARMSICSIKKGTRKDYYGPSKLYKSKTTLEEALREGEYFCNK